MNVERPLVQVKHVFGEMARKMFLAVGAKVRQMQVIA
jgi:hypothetical protein